MSRRGLCDSECFTGVLGRKFVLLPTWAKAKDGRKVAKLWVMESRLQTPREMLSLLLERNCRDKLFSCGILNQGLNLSLLH